MLMMPSLGSSILRLLALSSAWTPHSQAQSPDPAQPSDSTTTTTTTTSSPSSSTPPPSTPSTVPTCDARTINYITHTLPQSCLTSSWTSTATPSSANSSSADASSDVTNAASSGSSPDGESKPASTNTAGDEDSQDGSGDGEGVAKPFMSFEAWKEKMLRETGQDPKDLGSRNANPRRNADDRIPPDMGQGGLGEEDEIALNFDSYLDDSGAGSQKDRPQGSDVDKAGDGSSGGQGVVTHEDGRPSTHRSKDAGKTCKERFSYSSFDAGATVLKTSPGAKNPRAILVENKDSYMLLECSAKSKFVIVELSDDVLIDTVVLANFEFFSSMIRRFRISVSDRYPVKSDRWKEIGVFEARNSRDIQPFLVENPQIWAKYVRVEFLTHYGNEYYCPVSLLRIHGSRMLDSWKDADGGRDDDSHDENEQPPQQELPSPDETVKALEIEGAQETTKPASTEEIPYCPVTASTDLFLLPLFCPVPLNTTSETPSTQHDTASANSTSASTQNTSTDDKERSGASTAHARRAEYSATEDSTSSSSTDSPSATPAVSPTSPSSISSSSISTTTNTTTQSTTTSKTTISNSYSPSPSSSTSSTTSQTSVAKPPSPANTVTPKNRTTSAPPASPTVQEGFFKAISKRLHQVESNLTLSLQYVEDQARHMSETLHRAEQKQISKATLFLDNLNQTVLAELRSIREQYDQIWQSTVIALESQREQSDREIVALSTRLNLLADEVVFQKRMAIVQAVLLLSCLLLVIFSRGVSLPYLAPYDASASAATRVRALYANSYGADGDDPSLLGSRQRAEYISVPGEAPSPNLRQRASFVDDSESAHLGSEQLSPPPTPGPADGYTSSSGVALPSHESQTKVLRRLPAMHQGNSRKPLPALPENPSSP
ncbi:hypothetical protein ACJ41O_000393 [Fusarium nematophilum]